MIKSQLELPNKNTLESREGKLLEKKGTEKQRRPRANFLCSRPTTPLNLAKKKKQEKKKGDKRINRVRRKKTYLIPPE